MIRLNGPLRSAMIGDFGLGIMMQHGAIKLMSGPQPDSADDALTGTLMGIITNEGRPFIPGNRAGGLKLGLGMYHGMLTKVGDWVLTALADGEPGWWRYCWNGTDTGAALENVPRIDGLIGESLLLPNPTLANGTTQPVADFTIFLPPYL